MRALNALFQSPKVRFIFSCRALISKLLIRISFWISIQRLPTLQRVKVGLTHWNGGMEKGTRRIESSKRRRRRNVWTRRVRMGRHIRTLISYWNQKICSLHWYYGSGLISYKRIDWVCSLDCKNIFRILDKSWIEELEERYSTVRIDFKWREDFNRSWGCSIKLIWGWRKPIY